MPYESENERLQRELNEAKKLLDSFQRQGTRISVSAKRGVSVYGLGRYPVTLYKSQWRKLLAMKGTILGFIVEHESELPEKNE